jgi:DnaJ-class molecular chaperone
MKNWEKEFDKRFCIKDQDEFFDIEEWRSENCIKTRQPKPSEIKAFIREVVIGGIIEKNAPEIEKANKCIGDLESRKPHTCPVCGGAGQVQAGFYNIGAAATGSTVPETCRACGGSGIVWR